VTPHRGEEERAHAQLLPVPDDVVHDGRDIVNAAAADADRNPRSGLQLRGKGTSAKLLAHFGSNIGNAAIGKVLAKNEQAGELHDGPILTGYGIRFPVTWNVRPSAVTVNEISSPASFPW